MDSGVKFKLIGFQLSKHLYRIIDLRDIMLRRYVVPVRPGTLFFARRDVIAKTIRVRLDLYESQRLGEGKCAVQVIGVRTVIVHPKSIP